MRVLQLSWEYPPRVFGGLGRHVAGLTTALARLDHPVTVVTPGDADGASHEIRDGVTVRRCLAQSFDLASDDWMEQVQADNRAMADTALSLEDLDRVQVVHAHDWMAGEAAIRVRAATGIPLVATIHATERGRHQGWLPGELSRAVDRVEQRLADAADRVITCSRWMRGEVAAAFRIPATKIAVVSNGVAGQGAASESIVAGKWRPTAGKALVVYAGRLEHEKGVHVLLDAVERLPNVVLIVAGQGTRRAQLEQQAATLAITERVRFAGHLDELELNELYRSADVVVVPSLYEPFGLVALEALAAGAPLVVSAVGGLAELTADGKVALQVPAADPAALARAVRRLLDDRELATGLARAGQRRVLTSFGWGTAARATVEVYRATLTAARS